MFFLSSLAQIFWTIFSFLRLPFWSSTSSLIANLEEASAQARSYEEWLQCQEQLDAISGANSW